MKKSIILLSIVLIVSCATTSVNFFDTIDNLLISEYQALDNRQQLLICEGFLIGACQFDGKAFITYEVSAMDLHRSVINIIREYNPDDRVLVSVFHIAMFKIITPMQDA